MVTHLGTKRAYAAQSAFVTATLNRCHKSELCKWQYSSGLDI